ncbi:MAG: Spx/MgsR family RNA polymerase-binding regulatory protein [Bdellovibrionales bacterium]|nr:Spx/MgsR family RNA polymerase-binding regulatory protein [Bdellovibrionales bacterium]
MSKNKFYFYKKCSTCIKAKKYLDNKKIFYEEIDITLQPPSKKEIEIMLEAYSGDLKKLFNTSGVQYRELKIKDKIKDMTKKQAVDLLSKNGKLVKRPFLLAGKASFVGFKQEEWQEFFN